VINPNSHFVFMKTRETREEKKKQREREKEWDRLHPRKKEDADVVEIRISDEEWLKNRERDLRSYKMLIEMEMRDFDSLPREVRDALNYQTRHELTAMGILNKHRVMSRNRKITPFGVLKLAQKRRIRMDLL